MNRPALKVLFLTRYPEEGASSRYRVFQYLPFMTELDVTCVTQSFMNSDMYQTYFSPGNTLRKLLQMLSASVRRLAVLRHFRKYDILYMQRDLFPFGPPLVERMLKKHGAVLLFDYDDALFIPKPNRYNPIATYLKSPTKIGELLRIADCVVAGNDWLRERALQLGANAVTLEVAEDTTRIKAHAPHTNQQPVTIGWLGSTSTVKYLDLIAPALQRIARDFPTVKFELMGGGQFQMAGVNWQHSTWSLDAELQALARFDIGLMPLPAEDWSQGKCGGKARTYMAAGVVPVCTGIGYNISLIRDRETGFLCRSEQDWYDTLSTLVNDAELRNRVAAAARSEVIRKFSVSGQAGKMRELFDHVLGFRPQ